MPVTFHPAKHNATPFPLPEPKWKEEAPATRILRASSETPWIQKFGEIFQSSLDSKPSSADSDIIPSNNGFVHTVVKAYSGHRALILRPDDVWLCILTQFSFFVNGNAEQLRNQFVAHEGKKELEITTAGTRYTVDFGDIARQMTELIEQNVVDPDLREWIMPAYTTTTLLDTTVSAIVMMATMKEYFSYKCSIYCGIPHVTLEGTKEDWENILSRIGKLKQYGPETTAWYELLHPVISRFVNAFDNPDGQDNLDFWQKVAHYEGGGSGPTWLAGWINAFCVFDCKGRWIGYPVGKVSSNIRLLEHGLIDVDLQTPKPPQDTFGPPHTQHYLTLDGAIYHRTETGDIPSGVVEVDLLLDDNGTVYNTLMTAGLVGTRVCDSGDKALSPNGTMDTAKPVLAWWISLKKDDPASTES
ncbi:hypothetical protein FIBSPDRAFT_835817 [Athelia psychrophila]|uniref:DUF4419 domain-containing protein n=1 Tax=Athelia psychrophila TaxID=1759441 RepID=A0A166BLZ6_9AGAM|nr:hypothetical protein FIBSPDRAFT_835817 [Fibularhizoctonia sp. CBS 109695]